MADVWLTSEHFDAVRGLISPDVTAVHIPDAYLEQEPFGPDASREVWKRLCRFGINPDSLVNHARRDAIVAMMHQCASVLCLTAPQMIRQTQLQVAIEVQTIDWQEKCAFHASKVDDKIAVIRERVSGLAPGTTLRTRRGFPFAVVGRS